MAADMLITAFQNRLAGAAIEGNLAFNRDGNEQIQAFHCVLKSVAKLAGKDVWIFRISSHFGGAESVVPVRGRVQWVGSLPIVISNDALLQEGRTASFQVVIDTDHGLFSGIWRSGETHGFLFGKIEKAPPPVHPRHYVIERTSEFVREWWTERGWTSDDAEATWYGQEPDAPKVSGDEDARPCFYPGGEVEPG